MFSKTQFLCTISIDENIIDELTITCRICQYYLPSKFYAMGITKHTHNITFSTTIETTKHGYQQQRLYPQNLANEIPLRP